VIVRPELVVEIALDGVQSSTRYPGGIALRFARVKRFRPDKEESMRTRSTTSVLCFVHSHARSLCRTGADRLSL
jgi:ATP-dependent DNA ligase